MEHRVKKCEICGSSADVKVIASHFGSYSYASCSHCACLELEPYSNVVAFKFTVGIDTPIQDEYEKQIDAILNFFHKTREDLANDVVKEEEKFLQWCEENS